MRCEPQKPSAEEVQFWLITAFVSAGAGILLDRLVLLERYPLRETRSAAYPAQVDPTSQKLKLEFTSQEPEGTIVYQLECDKPPGSLGQCHLRGKRSPQLEF